MLFREPSWWYFTKSSWQAVLLAPVSYLWGVFASQRMKRPARIISPLPVICIGNFTAGGTGKTPLSIFVAKELQKWGYKPIFLSRGYGSHVQKPRFVKPDSHGAKEVGDEPLLLSAIAPVMVAANKAKGIEAILQSKIDGNIIIMDDGLQNSSVRKDCTLAVVDGYRGLGNNYVIPSGPLRAPLNEQLNLVDIIVVNTLDSERRPRTEELEIRLNFKGPLFHAFPQASHETEWLKEAKVCAFTGIAHPNRFYTLLENLGAHLMERHTFPDHHMFTENEAETLLQKARQSGGILVTTEKDWVRLDQSKNAQKELKSFSRFVPIALKFDGLEAENLLRAIERRISIPCKR